MIFQLHSRLILWNLLIIGLMSEILGYFLNYSLRNDINQEIEDELRGESALAVAYIQAAHAGPTDEVADELGKMLNRRVTLIAFDGHVMGDSDLDAEGLANV